MDVAHFAAARNVSEDPPDQAGIPRPRLGYYGVIDERLDMHLIAGVADARPDWQLVLVGPVAKIEPESVPRRPNVHLLGQKGYDELPAYVAGWCVALMPFAINDATRFISPTKTPEYLAAGLPVVSTPIRDVVRPYGDEGLVHIASDVSEFVAAVERALAEREDAERLRRADAHLTESSWDYTWADMRELVEAAARTRRESRTLRRVRRTPRPFDWLVVGAGFAGSVLAERLASRLDRRVLVVDRRAHVGGNAYDHHDDAGVLVHRYGPHIFHTNSREVFDYLSAFTEWRPYEHRVLASVDGQLVPLPINLDTVNRLYGLDLTSLELEHFFASVAEPRNPVRTSEDVVVSKVGRDLYLKFFRNYTRKQWNLDPSELDASVAARVPARLNRDDRYFTDTYQAIVVGVRRGRVGRPARRRQHELRGRRVRRRRRHAACHGGRGARRVARARPQRASSRRRRAPWWRRDMRLWYEAVGERRDGEPRDGRAQAAARPVLVAGATGTLGRAFAAACELRGLAYRLTSRADMDAADPTSVRSTLAGLDPWAVVNATGYVRVDEAETDGEACLRANALAPEVLARACALRGLPLASFSSDLVFDGRAGRSYVETDAPSPLSVYGATKAAGERAALRAHDGALVVRTSAFFGPVDAHNFVTAALRAFRAGERFVAADDLVVTATYVPDLVHATLDLLIDGETGLWHLASPGAVTWAELARRAAAAAGVAPTSLDARPAAECGFVAPRPSYVPLASERGALMPSLDDALARYAAEVS